ncbi:putative GDSL-like Lipase/Acylhydrolase superfamily protein [Hibiscus syriacus]|uniref:GDSL-like Lipase/Acylhydrolase superfamily protein n=1 Tax=Hibiscus syriacus TaxID=106335 RepID=A0A6A3B2A2_HIBSY|nr:putative GDSL-like Lipase/Acylhydrolase superfamily protein [Hibiscus syriacus]
MMEMTSRREWFHHYEPVSGGSVYSCNDHALEIVGVRTIKLKMYDETIKIVRDVRYVKGLKKNLLSYGLLDNNASKIETRKGIMKVFRGVLVVLKGEKIAANLYMLKGETLLEAEASVASCSSDSAMLWHQKLGHMSEQGMKVIMEQKLLPSLTNVSLPLCEHCITTIGFAQNITAFFIFEDSLVEVGNNYFIDTLAKPRFPNGIDFPRGEALGFQDYTPPFLAPNSTGGMILKGVNYAFSGAGILQAHRSLFIKRFPQFNNQVNILISSCENRLYNMDARKFAVLGVSKAGIENIDYACCEVIGRHGGLIPCTEMSRVCSDRTKYLFWDPFHPTESAILIATKYMLDGGPEYVSPVNINQLTNS